MSKILLIDDSGAALNARREYLLSLKHVPMNANTKKVAVGLLSRMDFDCVVMNLDMRSDPPMKAFKELRSLSFLSDTPFIVVTRTPASNNAQECMTYDNVLVLAAPYENEELKSMIDHLLNPEAEDEQEEQANDKDDKDGKAKVADKANAADAEKPSDAESEDTEDEEEAETEKDTRKKVLIVDDDEIALDTLNLYLDEKYRTALAASGREALNMLDAFEPDAILLDVRMPNIDGLEFLRRIRANKETKNIPVIFQTGMSDLDTVRECISIGASGYIIKPIKKDILISKLEECLGSARKVRQILLIEPEMVLSNIMKHHLRDDFNVSVECSMPLAMTLLSRQQPDLIVLDDESPCIAFYRLRSKAGGVPVLLMPELCSDSAELEKCVSAGAAGIIDNIYDKNAVVKIVNEIFYGKPAEEETEEEEPEEEAEPERPVRRGRYD